MYDKLKGAFDQIHAEEALKDKTREFILYNTLRSQTYKTKMYRRQVLSMVCLLLVIMGGMGYKIYFSLASIISVDINPSVELGINVFNKVISVEGYNADGIVLADSLNVKFLDYTEALDQILNSESIINYLSQDEVLAITVIGKDEERNRKSLANIESCIAGEKNVYCYSAHTKEVEEAHQLGLSYGKYRKFLELQELDSNITIEDIQKMTMCEIQDLILRLSGENPNSFHNSKNRQDMGSEQGKHNGQMNGRMNGQYRK